jgi:hypothetical protein
VRECGRNEKREGEGKIFQRLPLSNVAGHDRKMTTTHGGHVYYVIKVPKDSTDGNER